MTLNTSESQRVSLTVKPSNAKLSGSLKSLRKRESICIQRPALTVLALYQNE